MTKKKRADKSSGESDVPLRSAEGVMADLQRLLAAQNFESIEEANKFLEDLFKSTGGKVPAFTPTTPLEQAQDLMYEAWETTSRAKRIKLARQALVISVDCADAYTLLAEENTETLAEARALYEQAVKAGERAIGEEMFKKAQGHFWAALETRPYMRARLGLALTLVTMGDLAGAIDHLKDMLRLNPNDNQGVRYLLVVLLFDAGDFAALEALLKQYRDEWSATWTYTRALAAFRREGKSKRAQKLLKEALERNRLVPDYLMGKKRLPKAIPQSISPGTDSEAVEYAARGIRQWQTIEGAINWLRETVNRESGSEPT